METQEHLTIAGDTAIKELWKKILVTKVRDVLLPVAEDSLVNHMLGVDTDVHNQPGTPTIELRAQLSLNYNILVKDSTLRSMWFTGENSATEQAAHEAARAFKHGLYASIVDRLLSIHQMAVRGAHHTVLAMELQTLLEELR
jgi:hypothetical protein